MKIKFFSFGRSAVLFTLAVLLAFVFNACAGGAGSAVDDFTADGDYYNDGGTGSNAPVINVSIPTGLGWVSNGSVSGTSGSSSGSSSTNLRDSTLSGSEYVQLDSARNQAQQGNYSAALTILDDLLDKNPNSAEAQELYKYIKRYQELPGLISSAEAQLEKLNKEIADLESRIAKQQKIVDNALKDMNDKYEVFKSICEQIEEKNKEIATLNTQISANEKTLADLAGQIANETDPTKKAQLQAQYNSLKQQNDALKSQRDNLLAELEILKAQKEEAYKQYLAAKDYYEKQLAILQELLAEYNSKCSQREELIQKIKDLKSEYETLKNYLKGLDYTSTGLGDYSYSMRWIVNEGTSVSSAWKDISRFIYEDTDYAIIGKFGNKTYTEDNYVTLRFRYITGNGRRVTSPYSGRYWGREFGYSANTGNMEHQHYEWFSLGSATYYYDNIPTNTPYAVITGGFHSDPGNWNEWVISSFGATYVTDIVRVTICDMNGNEIDELNCEARNFTFSGSGDMLNLFKSRLLAQDEKEALKFPVTNVTLFARNDKVKK